MFSIATLGCKASVDTGSISHTKRLPSVPPSRDRTSPFGLHRYKPVRARIHLPDKEFRSSRFVIVVLSLALLGLHVAMQFGPYLHPAAGMSGVWPLRILITSSFDQSFLLIVRTRRFVTHSY